MFLARVLTVTRTSGFGLVFGVATWLIGSCTVLPDEGERLRIERVEEAVLPMARIALEAEQTETATRLYRRLLEVDPDSVSARMGLGDVAVAGRDSAAAARWYAAAVAHARRADERHPALLAHGRAALATGELESARRSFSLLTFEKEQAPTLSVAWGLNGMGLVALLEGDIRAAVRFMEQAVLAAPEENMLADNLSRVLDLSAGMASENENGARVDRMQDMAVAAAVPSIPDVRVPRPIGDATTAVGKDAAEDRTPEESNRQAYPMPDTGEREAPPVGLGSGSDRRRIDRSELRPYAIKVGGEYYVRIGAHTLRAEAQDVAAEIRRVSAETVDVVEFGMVDGRNAVRLYRVLVGPIASSAGLVELVATLEELGYGAARVPPSVASQSGPAAARPVERSSDRRSVGPDLVEVFLDPGADETDAMRTATLQAETIPEAAQESGKPEAVPQPEAVPEPPLEGESPDAVRTAVTQAEAMPAPVLEGESPDAPRTVASRSEAGSDLAPERGSPDATSVEDVPSRGNADLEPGTENPGSMSTDTAVAPVLGNTAGAGEEEGEEKREEEREWEWEGEGMQDAPHFLQVGAYTMRSAAETLAVEVGGVARAPVRVVEAELANGETMYRVQVGPIESRRAMKELGEMLISGGYGTVRVLPESATADSALGDALPVPPPPSGSSERRVKAFIVNEDGKRFLQMGAYAVRATADTLASQLRLATSEPAFAAEVVNDAGESLYRVRIGPIKSDAALATLLRALRSSYGNGWVMPSMDADPTSVAFIVHEDSERFLQMGAYAVRMAAEALASRLRGQIDGEIRVTEVSRGDGEPVYRVRVGPIASDDSLPALLEAVESLGYVVD